MALAPSALPELPPQALQQLIDDAAHFFVYSRARSESSVTAIRDRDRLVGLQIEESWLRMRALTLGPPWLPPRANDLGEEVARVRQRWLFCPDAFAGRPDRDPPPTPFDASRSQRLVMAGRAEFDHTPGVLTLYGAGHTTPTRPGLPVLVQAGAAALGGTGVFDGFDEATLAYCGTLCAKNGFEGNVLVRAMDRRQRLRTDRLAPGFRLGGQARDGARYVILRGQASPSDPVSPRLTPEGRPAGLVVVQSLRGLDVDCWVGRQQGVQTRDSVGPLVGQITAHVAFDPQAPGGSVLDPIPFTTFDEFEFRDPHGRRVGGFTADTREGRVFRTMIGGRPGIRFVGVGFIAEGDGVFAGIHGQMTDSSVVLFEPHVSASVYVLRIISARA